MGYPCDPTSMIQLVLAAVIQAASAEGEQQTSPGRSPELAARIEANPELLLPARWASGLNPGPEWPRAAYEAGLEGQAILTCIVDTAGRARLCQAVSETPEGSGFAEAALSAADEFRWSPATFDGEPVESRVSFAFPFRFGETVKSPPELQLVMEAISADGYATGACRMFAEARVRRHWENVEVAIRERPTAEHRPYNRIFVDGYRRGQEWTAEEGTPTRSQCDTLRRWAADLQKDAVPALRKLDAQMLPDERQQFRPEPIVE